MGGPRASGRIGSVRLGFLRDEHHVAMPGSAPGADEPFPQASGFVVESEPIRQGCYVHRRDMLTGPAGHPQGEGRPDHVAQAMKVLPPHGAG